MANATPENIRRRHIERQKKRIRQMKRRRIITISLLISIVLLIVIFFTPLFDIRKIEVEGNSKITTAEINDCLDNTIGKNIFRYRTGTPIKNLKKIPYLNTAEINKSVFSCKLTVAITECIPAAIIEVGEKKVIIDSSLKVLEVVDQTDLNLPVITDITLLDIKPGSKITLQNEETLNIISLAIPVFEKEGLLEGVQYISFKDTENITFNYQDRLDVICGDSLEFEKKIKLFNQAINTTTLTENSRGTIDLSVLGQAVYTP